MKPDSNFYFHKDYPWICIAFGLERQGNLGAALDIIYKNVGEYIKLNNVDHIDNLLFNVAILNSMSTDLILGLLTATKRYQRSLNNRDFAIEYARRLLDVRGENSEILLKYL